MVEQWKPLAENEEVKAKEIEKEYAKYQEQKELAKKKKQKEADEIENLRKQVALEKEKNSKRNEAVATYNEKLKLQKELSEIKSARERAVTQNVKNIFTNIGTTFGNVGKSLGMNGEQPAQKQVRPIMQPQPVMNPYMPRVKAKVMTQRKKKLKGKLKRARRTTIPRIRRANRMPVIKQKAFDINDVLRGMPQ